MAQIEPRTQTHIHTHTPQKKNVRVYAVEMHINVSQKPLRSEICGKNAAAQMGPERGDSFCASLRNRNACQNFTRTTSHGN